MDSSRGFITKLVDEDKFNEAIRSKITPRLLGDEAGTILRYIERHYKEYASVPSRDAILKAFPNWEFGDYKEPFEYFVNELKEEHRRGIFEERIADIANSYLRDTSKAERTLRETLAELQDTTATFKDLDLIESAQERINAYKVRKQNPGVTGIRSGWNTMDNETLGWQAEEFAVLVGEKHVGKSWIGIWLAYQAMIQNERVLFAGKEMSQHAVSKRFDSIYAKIPYHSLRKGELTDIEETRYNKALQELGDKSHNFVVARKGIHSIDDIRAKAIEKDSTIVFVDSVYLFEPKVSTQGEVSKRMQISHECKNLAEELGIPVIVSVQGGRRKKPKKGPLPPPDLDGIEWSNAFAQDADTVFFIQKDEIDKELNRMQVWLLKSREGELAEFFVNTNRETQQFDERTDSNKPKTQVFEDEDESVFDE